MLKAIPVFILSVLYSFSLCSQKVERGPFTVFLLANGVYHIEDANSYNPAGMHMNKDGEMAGMNNCSDMYLVTGKEKALLIDLSNSIKWDSSAIESIRSIVFERAGNKDLLITVTHKHGDHLGMLPAFYDDPGVTFWIPEAEFKGSKFFPEERTIYFEQNSSYDLGNGFIINTLEVPGHTEHSTLFFLNMANMVFTGDAIGSGSGVWLFNYESFETYKTAIEDLIRYIEDPDNGINTEELEIHGGHAWQKGKLPKLSSKYIYDMQALIDRIGKGTADTEDNSTFISFLDTNFRYGTATITWNREAARKYATKISDGK